MLLITERTRTYASQSKRIEVNIKLIFYAFIPFAVAAILRVYPHLISGLPFSLGSWTSIKYAELLLKVQEYRSVGWVKKVLSNETVACDAKLLTYLNATLIWGLTNFKV